jgi:hypothetical protein
MRTESKKYKRIRTVYHGAALAVSLRGKRHKTDRRVVRFS